MPRSFNKEARDEWLARMAGKSHACEACCDGDCEDCAGTCDCSKCHGKKGATTLDALESKTAEFYPGQQGNSAEEMAYMDHAHPINYSAGLQALEKEHQRGLHLRRQDHNCPLCEHIGEGWVDNGMERYHPAYGKTADASLPPQGAPFQQKETALPYNPSAYEQGVEDMHPAAQYTYQRAVQQGADPQAAYAAAQEKQGEMGKRTQEGQNVEGVQIPVINTSYHGDRIGFVSAATIKRVSHLTS